MDGQKSRTRRLLTLHKTLSTYWWMKALLSASAYKNGAVSNKG